MAAKRTFRRRDLADECGARSGRRHAAPPPAGRDGDDGPSSCAASTGCGRSGPSAARRPGGSRRPAGWRILGPGQPAARPCRGAPDAWHRLPAASGGRLARTTTAAATPAGLRALAPVRPAGSASRRRTVRYPMHRRTATGACHGADNHGAGNDGAGRAMAPGGACFQPAAVEAASPSSNLGMLPPSLDNFAGARMGAQGRPRRGRGSRRARTATTVRCL